MIEPAIFGPLDAVLTQRVGPEYLVTYLVLALVLANLATRFLAHRRHVRQSRDGADAIRRHRVHELSNVVLLLVTFYFVTVEYHAGIVLLTLVLGMFVADFFELEARRVEAREELELEAPKGALFASVIVLAYAAYLALFFLVAPLWNAVI